MLEPFKTRLTGGEAETPPAQPLFAAESYCRMHVTGNSSSQVGIDKGSYSSFCASPRPSPPCLRWRPRDLRRTGSHRTLLFNVPSFIATIHEYTKPDRFFKYSSIDFYTSEAPHLIIKPVPFKVNRQGSSEACATQRSAACYPRYLVRLLLSNEGKILPSEEPHNLTLWRSERFEILVWH